MAKKQKRSNLRLTNGNNSMEKQVEEKPLTSQPENIGEATIAAPEATYAPCGDLQQASDVMKRAQGKKFKIRYNKLGIPMGDERHKLQSYLGMLARIMVPIDIPSWTEVDLNLKAKIWDDIRSLSKEQSERVSERKYLHRTSRKGYIGLEEEEVKAGRLEPDEIPDATIFLKIAGTPPEGTVIDDDLKETFEKIDDLIEKKRKDEFIPYGSKDVLSVALNTPEHSGQGSPKQPGGSECGYVVMRYMKDIYEDKEMKFLSKSTKATNFEQQSVESQVNSDVPRAINLPHSTGTEVLKVNLEAPIHLSTILEDVELTAEGVEASKATGSHTVQISNYILHAEAGDEVQQLVQNPIAIEESNVGEEANFSNAITDPEDDLFFLEDMHMHVRQQKMKELDARKKQDYFDNL
ncbi:hypothetical protein AgCh_034347 [Apium graveolens]